MAKKGSLAWLSDGNSGKAEAQGEVPVQCCVRDKSRTNDPGSNKADRSARAAATVDLPA